MSHDSNNARQPSEKYGFKADLREKKHEVEFRLDAVDKFNMPYSIIPIRLVYSIIMIAGILMSTVVFVISDLLRAVYLSVGILLLVLGLVTLVGLYAFIYPSFYSLLNIAMTFMNQLINMRRVKSGKTNRSKRTGFKETREDGLIQYAVGDVGRLFLLDGKTSQTSYPAEIVHQEAVARTYHNTRERDTTEIIITSSQKQNTDMQLDNMKVLEEINSDPAIREMIQIQHSYTESRIKGKITTFVQYLLMVAPNEEKLEESMSSLYDSVESGLYYNVKALNKSETDRILRDIKGLK
ncbi:TPA_asm: hypothetical protein GZX72_14430 [Listeria monocytogenes]|nr:hypothetical protein [Listeria monocytogenes]